jgi:hypothetical protein
MNRNNNSKSVSFHDDVSVVDVPSLSDYSEEELQALFFSRSDYHMTRSAARIVSKEAARYGFSKSLDESWAEKDPAIQEKLNLWSANGATRRGLERWCSSVHGEQRQAHQFQAIMAVLRAQEDGVSTEKLRKISGKHTKIARHFARQMGKADSYAVASELQESVEAASNVTQTSDAASVITSTETVDDELISSSHSRLRRLFRREKEPRPVVPAKKSEARVSRMA